MTPSEAYDFVDRKLRQTSDDEAYQKGSAALEVLWSDGAELRARVEVLRIQPELALETGQQLVDLPRQTLPA